MNGNDLIKDFGAFVKALPDAVAGSMSLTRVDGSLYQVEVLRVDQPVESEEVVE